MTASGENLSRPMLAMTRASRARSDEDSAVLKRVLRGFGRFSEDAGIGRYCKQDYTVAVDFNFEGLLTVAGSGPLNRVCRHLNYYDAPAWGKWGVSGESMAKGSLKVKLRPALADGVADELAAGGKLAELYESYCAELCSYLRRTFGARPTRCAGRGA